MSRPEPEHTAPPSGRRTLFRGLLELIIKVLERRRPFATISLPKTSYLMDSKRAMFNLWKLADGMALFCPVTGRS